VQCKGGRRTWTTYMYYIYPNHGVPRSWQGITKYQKIRENKIFYLILSVVYITRIRYLYSVSKGGLVLLIMESHMLVSEITTVLDAWSLAGRLLKASAITLRVSVSCTQTCKICLVHCSSDLPFDLCIPVQQQKMYPIIKIAPK
jgi:hypothetical protein